MKMNVVKEFDNKLLKRKEVEVVEKYDSNPGFSRVIEDVASKFKVEQEAVVIKRINSHFGSNSFLVDAFIYDSAEQKDKIEPKKKEKKK